jgi:hypothetical protein
VHVDHNLAALTLKNAPGDPKYRLYSGQGVTRAHAECSLRLARRRMQARLVS